MLFFMLLPYGSVEYQPLHLVASGFFIVTAIASLVCRPPLAVQTAWAIAITIAALLAIWLIVQATGFAGNPFANPIWKDVARIIGPVTP